MFLLPPPKAQPWPDEWKATPPQSGALNSTALENVVIHWDIVIDHQRVGSGCVVFTISKLNKHSTTSLL